MKPAGGRPAPASRSRRSISSRAVGWHSLALVPAQLRRRAAGDAVLHGGGWTVDDQWAFQHYLPDGVDHADPCVFALRAADLSGLPAALIVTAEFDPLRYEGRAYAGRLPAAGVAVEYVHLDDQLHGFLLREATVDRAREAVDHFADAIRRALA